LEKIRSEALERFIESSVNVVTDEVIFDAEAPMEAPITLSPLGTSSIPPDVLETETTAGALSTSASVSFVCFILNTCLCDRFFYWGKQEGKSRPTIPMMTDDGDGVKTFANPNPSRDLFLFHVAC
jgi:hypothetical protein